MLADLLPLCSDTECKTSVYGDGVFPGCRCDVVVRVVLVLGLKATGSRICDLELEHLIPRLNAQQ